MTAGKLKVVTYADLGGLGLTQGTPVAYDWVMPSLLPQVLPWLAILALLLLKPNRCASAWWIWVPLACMSVLTLTPHWVVGLLASWISATAQAGVHAQLEILLEFICALGFGQAALWLLASYLGWKHRMLAFVGILLAQGVFSSLAFVVGEGRDLEAVETLQLGFGLMLIVLGISVALTLAGLACRGRYGWRRLSLWLMAALVVVCLLVIGTFFVIMVNSSGGNFPVLALFWWVGIAAGTTLGMLLPFLVLSFANGFYRERLKGLLHLGRAAAPPMITPPMPAIAAASTS
jgi:hypothetical protein